MNKKMLALSGLALSFAIALPALARIPRFPRTSTSTGAASPNAAAAIACVGAAVNTREAAIDAAVATHTQAIVAAYAARAAALKQAYSSTNPSDVRTATKAAWKTFSASIKSAAQGWRTAQRAAWSAFRTASEACHPTAGVSDNGNSGAEVSGQ